VVWYVAVASGFTTPFLLASKSQAWILLAFD